jgi:hypothetical protein
MHRSTYRQISSIGSNSYNPVNNPLTYCVGTNAGQKFLHGSGSATVNGEHSKHCQIYMSEYCSDKWDDICEVASKNTNGEYPNNAQACEIFGDTACKGLTAGEILIRNTASKKYLKHMGNCTKKYEPFDPLVPTSPLISYWSNDYSINCVPVYEVNPTIINDDVVMDKLIAKPIIAIEILINIYNTMKREKTLTQLTDTKLGQFYNTNAYFKSKGGLKLNN